MLQERCVIAATRFQIDFEAAAIKAIRHVFPNARVTGCFFHFTQAVWRKVGKVGLQSQYNDGDEKIIKIVRRYAALPLLKVEDIDDAFLSVNTLIADFSAGNVCSPPVLATC
jgi:hypothetical protein